MKNAFRLIFKALMLVALASTVHSCMKKFDFSDMDYSTEINSHLGIPVAKGDFYIRDLIKESPKTESNPFALEYYSQKGGPRDSVFGTYIRLIYDIDTISKFTAHEYLRVKGFGAKVFDKTFETFPISDQLATNGLTFNQFTNDNFDAGSYNYYVSRTNSSVLQAHTGNNTKSLGQRYKLDIDGLDGDKWVIYKVQGQIKCMLKNDANVPLKCKVELLAMFPNQPNPIVIHEFDFTKPVGDEWDSVVAKSLNNGDTITSELYYRFKDIQLDQSTNIALDMNKLLHVEFLLNDLEARNGTALLGSSSTQKIRKDTTFWFQLFTYDNRKVSVVEIERANLVFDVKSTIKTKCRVTVTLPTAIDANKKIVSKTFEFVPDRKVEHKLDLSNCKVRLDSTNILEKAPGYDMLPVVMRYELSASTKPITFDARNNKLEFVVSNNDSLVFKQIVGDFGNDTIAMPKSQKDTLFSYDVGSFIKNNNLYSGAIEFEEPSFQVLYRNTFGMDAAVRLSVVSNGRVLVDSNKLQTLKRNQRTMSKFLDFGKAEINNLLDFATSIENKTVSLKTRGAVYVNHLDMNKPRTMYSDTIYKNSEFKVDIHAELPLKFKINDFILTPEPFVNSAGSSFDADNIEDIGELKIILWTENSIPLSCKLNIMMLDTTQLNPYLGYLTSSTNNYLFKAGVDGKPTTDRFIFTVNGDVASNFVKANKFKVEAVFNTKDNNGNAQVATLRTTDHLKFQMFVDAKAKYKVDPFKSDK